ncbi:putative ER to Golgi transport protein [Xylona heveae TC161]|uniref:Putative ER to Golgi transport protein n=1 Tax=Xylona heveae (strain CBS 132557 / TC161) TaxID=1328760 RepID=A0A165AKU4_XYLHT|nr:putative ER to Golgi transport protein [Xylona heveae TC161]KZF20653.1 putative ER to Golgi transport protein [Xylona heveae TC161]
MTSLAIEQRASTSERPLAFQPSDNIIIPVGTSETLSSFPQLDVKQTSFPSDTDVESFKNDGQADLWQTRKDNFMRWNEEGHRAVGGHGRQKSLSDALKTIRTRRGSVSANAHEIADALKAPVSPRLIFLCLVWYLSSALTNTSSKSILNAFAQPITLTLVQFGFVSSWCVFLAYVAHLNPSLRNVIPALRHGLRYPSKDVILTTLPLAAFQVGGHILSANATSKIPVSLVHTIKGLSPLFTVLAYRVLFKVHYATSTYLSLFPLTLGVMLACSAEFSGNFGGVLCAFGGAIIFVTQNIFSKKLFNEAARAEADGQRQKSRKLDKLNLLCYSSGLAFVLTFPLWLWTEGFSLLVDFFHDGALALSKNSDALGPSRLAAEFFFNGTFHFGQNIIAFVLLSAVSPVTYSVASLVKRIFVIVVAIVWFGNKTTIIQAVGISLTFIGLYLYDRSSDATKGRRRAQSTQRRVEGPLLPLTKDRKGRDGEPTMESGQATSSGQLFGSPHAFSGVNGDGKKLDGAGPGRARASSNAASWLPPGTRQEQTWKPEDTIAPRADPAPWTDTTVA